MRNADEGRLYLYRPVEAAVSPFGGRMEANAALAEVARAFPPESGLYKKGARLAEGILLLSFRFPKPAAERLVRVKAALSESTDIEALKQRFEENTAYQLDLLPE